MYRGTGVPQFGFSRVSYDMPIPDKGSRSEKFEPIQEIYENIRNELIVGDRKFRFVGEYEFSSVPSATVETLLNIYNTKSHMKWAPHKDLNKINYNVLIEELDVFPVNGLIDIDGVKIKVKSLFPISNVPSINTLYALTNYPRMVSYKLVQAADIVVGVEYAIEKYDTADFTAVGAANNLEGTIFTATGVPTGDGLLIVTE